MRNWLAGFLALTLIGGCATRQTVEDEGVKNNFSSKLRPSELAKCMARSVDGRIMGSLQAQIESSEGLVEVIVRNGQHIWSIAKIRASDRGSNADLYYGAAGKINIEKSRQWMTEGCS